MVGEQDVLYAGRAGTQRVFDETHALMMCRQHVTVQQLGVTIAAFDLDVAVVAQPLRHRIFVPMRHLIPKRCADNLHAPVVDRSALIVQDAHVRLQYRAAVQSRLNPSDHFVQGVAVIFVVAHHIKYFIKAVVGYHAFQKRHEIVELPGLGQIAGNHQQIVLRCRLPVAAEQGAVDFVQHIGLQQPAFIEQPFQMDIGDVVELDGAGCRHKKAF